MTKKLLTLFIICCFSVCCMVAQDQNDFVLLTQVNFQKKLDKHWGVNLGLQTYYNQNVTELYQFFTDVGFSYRFSKKISLYGTYRYQHRKNIQNFYRDIERFYGGITYAYPLSKKLDLIGRIQLQDQQYGMHLQDAQNYKHNSLYSRYKLTLKYQRNYYLSLYSSFELFYPLAFKGQKYVNQYRATIGCEYRLDKHHQFEPFYQILRPMYSHPLLTQYVLGLTYMYRF